MADLLKVLVDDHIETRKLFRRIGRNIGDGPLVDDAAPALAVCERLRVHDALEDELLYPLVRRHIGGTVAADAEDAHATVRSLVEELERLVALQDAGATRAALALERVVEDHVLVEERVIFPKLLPLTAELHDAGRLAFARMQQHLAAAAGRRPLLPAGVNSGWGHPVLGRRDLANAGW